ncbi:MAG: Rieske (2Fe-2S) protein [Acidobacteria bacterium]|nr:MAG: Rieske (2Fe-2S) protein [Acidobacteriota bacterium]
MTRRRFLELWQTLLAALAGAAALPPALFWWRSARLPAGPEEGTWADLGRARRLKEGQWVARSFAVERRDRWRQETLREVVYVRRRGEGFDVVSSLCPHAGCRVRPRDDGGFVCPCHRSAFDGDGRPLEGPSPRPLDPLPWKVEKGRLVVRHQRFRSGVAERQVVEG